MRYHKIWGALNVAVTTLHYLAIALGFLVAASLKVDTTVAEWAWASTPVYILKARAWWLVPGSLVVVSVSQWARRKIGDDAAWKTIKTLLEAYRQQLFGKQRNSAHHRVTLFRCDKGFFGIGARRLAPVERSGHTSRNSSVSFQVPDSADKAEGVAGQAWAHRTVVSVTSLPKIDDSSSDDDLEIYAKESFVTPPPNEIPRVLHISTSDVTARSERRALLRGLAGPAKPAFHASERGCLRRKEAL